jgi:hypothetical protein
MPFNLPGDEIDQQEKGAGGMVKEQKRGQRLIGEPPSDQVFATHKNEV